MSQTLFQTKSDYAYKIIKSQIMSGEYRPKDRLVISNLAKKLSVSEIPVRDALNKLTSEGLVDIGANNRSVVSSISHKEFTDALEVRKILEPLCSKLSTKYITDDTLKELERLINEMDHCIEGKDYEKFSILNRDFHKLMYSHCPNKKMVEVVEELNKISIRATQIFQIHPTRGETSNYEHKDLLEAIANKDEDRVYEIVLKQKEETFKTHIEDIK